MPNKKQIKKLTRPTQDRMVCGVCTGIGDYLSIDPTVVRLAFIILTAATGFGPGIIAYILACLVIPGK